MRPHCPPTTGRPLLATYIWPCTHLLLAGRLAAYYWPPTYYRTPNTEGLVLAVYRWPPNTGRLQPVGY